MNSVFQKQCFDAANKYHKNNRKRNHQQQHQQHENQHQNKRSKQHENNNNNNNLYKCQQNLLPIHFGRQALINEVINNPTVIVMSETGSGKTTQLPQYLLTTFLAKRGQICCTQPRRVAAITVADRVSKEKGGKVGDLVGYTVRFEDVTSAKTRLKYMTDGMLLREALLDPLLKRYSVIILDEAHERSIQTDVLFGVVKLAQIKRKTTRPLKIVIMSATLQADLFVKYFDDAKICYLEGRKYPIKIMYSDEVQKDYTHASLVTALQLHKEMPIGDDILVFLTGQEEIETLAQIMRDITLYSSDEYGKILVYPLFASLPNKEQMKAFQPAASGYRKIILATNIAETSVTIPGVKYVIDCGMVKAKAYNASNGLEMLKVQAVSKAQARQRCGRAGRECPGICYRLYSETIFHNLNEDTVPEIQRCNLKSVVLQLLAMGLTDILNFDFISAPSEDTLQDAFKQLVLLEAIESEESQKITAKGKTLSSFPLDPSLASCILAAQELGCTEELLTIVSLLSVDSVIYTPSQHREKSRKAFQKFVSSEGDQISLLKFYRAYKNARGNIDWCREHFVNMRNMKTVQLIRSQLRELCLRLNISLKSCGNDFTVIRQSLCGGLFANSAERQLDGTYMTILHKQTVFIHPSSVLFMLKPPYVIFNEVVKTSKCYMRDLCIVDPTWLVNICPTHFDAKRLLPQAITS